MKLNNLRYPNLNESKIISFDIETFDPNISSGPGVYRDDGRILGCAIANEDGFAEYYNLGHKGIKIEERNKNINYLKEVLGNNVDKLATNALYDMDWLQNWLGVKINGQIHDIQVAEPLLDEYKISYSLDNLAKEYLGKQKFKTEIDKFCEDNKLKGDPRQYLFLMPYEIVSKYAIQDVLLPIQIFEKQKEKLKEQELYELYLLEMKLYPLLLKMRSNGVRIDVNRLEQAKVDMKKHINCQTKLFNKEYGHYNYNSPKQVAELFDELDIPYNYTAKGNPSITKEDLKKVSHPVGGLILDLKHSNKIYSTFLENSFTNMRVADRIHCSFYPTKTESFGTKSGRFSSANPNLQQIPADKDDPVSKICRNLFIPEEDCYWGKIDYSQIEYRFIAHYAAGKKSADIRKQYNEDPKTDYHQLIMNWTGTTRKIAKNLNFGMAYCMGAKTCSEKFNWDIRKAENLISNYHEMVPFVRTTRNNVSSTAKGRGYIKTILGRRARMSKRMYEEGKEYTMFNRLIQGSSADMMKKAMYDCYIYGIFDVLTPHLTVHDELDVSVPKTKEGLLAFREMKDIMENTIKLKVPVIADAEIGSNWANCTEENYNKLIKEIM